MSNFEGNKKGSASDVVREYVSAKISSSGNEESAFKMLSNYVDCIMFWGKTHNVISRKFSDDDVWENVYDSVCAFTLLKSSIGENLLDAGTGGGVPGIPLAILFKEKNFLLVDSSRKKCSFLRLVKAKLALENVEIENKDLRSIKNVDHIITKAAFSPSNLYLLADAVKKNGRITLWATPKTNAEYENAFKKIGVLLLEKFDYQLPSGKERCLLVFEKQ